MRDVPATMSAAWRNGMMVGDRRPHARVTVEHPFMCLRRYTLTSTYTPVSTISGGIPNLTPITGKNPFKGRRIDQTYADFLWTNDYPAVEIPVVKRVSWSRTASGNVASGTIEVSGSLPADGEPLPRGQFERPMALWPTYGGTSYSKRWGHTVDSQWFGMLAPDNILRTYEGYGWDPEVLPNADPNLVSTGVWMIDKVYPGAGGRIIMEVRDVGRLLLEQMVFSPVIPPQFYPLSFQNWDGTVTIGGTSARKGRVKVSGLTSSNVPWVGTGTVGGHSVAHAFDGSGSSYWLSIGNEQASARFAYEWVQANVKGSVSEVRFLPKKKGYTAYISLMVGGVWQGSHTINYHEDGIGMNGADIKYYRSVVVKSEKEHVVSFPTVKNVQKVRVTFGNLQYFGEIGPYHYRAGIRDVKIFGEVVTDTSRKVPLTKGPAGANPGRIRDYSDIVALALAWGGFFWPQGARRHVKEAYAPSYDTVECSPATFMTSVLGEGVKGSLWADIENTGTAPVAPISPSNFDKRSLMDMISYVRNIVGFFFCIDESGAAQWRMPNLFNVGNMRTGLSANPGRTSDMVLIYDETNLLNSTPTLSSEAIREGIWVGDVSGRNTVVRPGWNPNPTGMRRMAGFTDVNLSSEEEAEMMADMIALRILMQYRTNRIGIAGYPMIQIDDQVRVIDRTSSDGFVHYVNGITSSNDLESGRWTYDLELVWLGQDPDSRWIFSIDQLGDQARSHISAATGSGYVPANRLEG